MQKYLTLLLFTLTLTHTSLIAKDINIDKTVVNSTKAGKSVVLYLHRIGCSYCNSMEEFTLDDDTVIKYMNQNFEMVNVNVSLKDKLTYKGEVSGGICLVKKINYSFYPAMIFLDENADIKYASLGYKSESEFLIILKYVKTGSHKTMTLDEYKEEQNYSHNLEDEINDERKFKR